MEITREHIAKIAELARLEPHPHIAERLSTIVKLFDQLKMINTDAIQPMAHPLNLSQPLRDDIVSETNQRDTLQKLAASVEAGLYLVPEVIESHE